MVRPNRETLANPSTGMVSPHSLISRIGEIFADLEKADTVLDEIMQHTSFANDADLMLHDESKQGEYLRDFGRIQALLDTLFDYIGSAKRELGETRKIDPRMIGSAESNARSTASGTAFAGNGNFDNKKHADTLLDIEGVIVYVMMLVQGLQSAAHVIDDREFLDTVSGALGLMSITLEQTYGTISDLGIDFCQSHGLSCVKGNREVSAWC